MFAFFAHVASPEESHHFEAHDSSGKVDTTLRATVTDKDGTLNIKAVVDYSKDIATRHYSGTLQPDGSIVGSQGNEEDETEHTAHFMWTRIPTELMALRPLPPYNVPSKSDGSLVPNKARAMFDYAIKAVIFQNRRKAWSWKYFEYRRDVRSLYLYSCELNELSGSTNPDLADPARNDNVFHRMAALDRDFYESLWDRYWKTYPEHT